MKRQISQEDLVLSSKKLRSESPSDQLLTAMESLNVEEGNNANTTTMGYAYSIDVLSAQEEDVLKNCSWYQTLPQRIVFANDVIMEEDVESTCSSVDTYTAERLEEEYVEDRDRFLHRAGRTEDELSTVSVNYREDCHPEELTMDPITNQKKWCVLHQVHHNVPFPSLETLMNKMEIDHLDTYLRVGLEVMIAILARTDGTLPACQDKYCHSQFCLVLGSVTRKNPVLMRNEKEFLKQFTIQELCLYLQEVKQRHSIVMWDHFVDLFSMECGMTKTNAGKIRAAMKNLLRIKMPINLNNCSSQYHTKEDVRIRT